VERQLMSANSGGRQSGGRQSGGRRLDGRRFIRQRDRYLCFVMGLLFCLALVRPAPSPAQAISEEMLVPSALAQFTSAVEDREPIDQVTFVSSDVRKIFFFSDLRGLQGHSVTHRWILDGKVMAEVQFEVRGPRWRVWSSKELLPGWLGDWMVEIVTDEGEVIAAETFTYSAPAA